MVTWTPQGRAGNFLFQLAAVIGYALKHNLEFTVPDRTNNAFWNPIYMQHLVNRNYKRNLPIVRVEERTHAYHEIPFEESWRNLNIILNGYWQSEKYFAHCREEVLNAFRIPYKMNEGVVSIHVRRGDYLQLPDKHPPVPLVWYLNAVNYFQGFGYYKFLVFSDDIKWCKENFKSEIFSFSEGNREMRDLELMANCEHNISSASTFGWFGAWLNRNPSKIIVIPKQWFVEGHGGLDTSDIVPESWIKL